MAIVDLPVQDATLAGMAPSYTGSLSTSNTYRFPNDGKTILHVKKAGAGACVATIATPVEHDGLAVADVAATVPASTGDRFIGPFKPGAFNTDGKAAVTFSEITGLTVAAIRIP